MFPQFFSGCFDKNTMVWKKEETQPDKDAVQISINMLQEGDLVGTGDMDRKSSMPNEFL